MATPAGILSLVVTANTAPADAALGRTQAKLRGVASTSTASAGAMKKSFAAIGVAAGAAAVGLFKVGEAFDDAYDKIQTRTGATGKDLKKLEGTFKNVLKAVPASFDDTAEAVSGLSQRLDLTGKPLEKLSKQVLNLSHITGEDLQGNVTNVTRLFGDWGIKTDKQTKTLDKLYRASQETGIQIGDLSELMVQFGSPLRQLGLDFDTAAAMFSRFEKEGVNIQTLMPGLRMALKNFSAPTDELAKTFDKLNISLKDPSQALRDVFAQLKSAPSDLKANALAFQVFGARAGPDMAAAVREGRFELDKLMKAIQDGDGTINKSAAQTRDFSEQWQLFKNRLAVLIEPAATAFFKLISDGMKAINKLDLKGIVKSLQEFWQKATFARETITAVWKVIVATFRNAVETIKGLVKIVSGVLTGNFGRAWEGVKDIFRSGIEWTKGVLKALVQPFGKIARTIGGGLADGFEWAWDKIKGVFEAGANALKDVVNWIISNVINRIPGVELDLIGGTSGGSGGGSQASPGRGDFGHHATGGKITKPMAIVGEEAPAHKEWVIATNPAYRNNNLAYWAQAGSDLGVPGFAQGGQMSPVNVASSIHGPGYYLDKLANAPFGGLPSFMSETGSYVKDKFSDFIKNTVDAVLPGGLASRNIDQAASQIKGSVGKLLRDNAYVDSHTLGVTSYLDSLFGLTMTSGYRSPAHNAAIGGAPGSFHTHGTPSNPGATDSVGSMSAMNSYIAFAKANVAGLQEAMVDNVGNGWNAHLAFFKEGGLIGRPIPAALQAYNHIYAKHVSPDYGGPTMPADKIAMLAEYFGMPGITMAQIARGESAYRPGAVGDDAAAGYGNTFGYGLWQITTGASGMDSVVNRMGGYDMMLNPIANAIVAGKMFASRGVAPWYGTQYMTSSNAHWNGSFGDTTSAAHPSNGGGSGGSGGSGGGHPGSFNPNHVNQGWWNVVTGGSLGNQPNPGGTSPWAAAFMRHMKLPDGMRKAIQEAAKAGETINSMIETATTLSGFASSPSGSDLSDGERLELIGLYQGYIGSLYDSWGKLEKGINWLHPNAPARGKLLDALAVIKGVGTGSVAAAMDEIYKLQNPTSTDAAAVVDAVDNSEQIALLKELLQQSNLRYLVSQAQYGVLGAMAKGGVVGKSGSYLVGEDGPEIVGLAAGQRVYSNRESQGIGSATVIINGDIINTPPGKQAVEVVGARAVVEQGSRGSGRRVLPGARSY